LIQHHIRAMCIMIDSCSPRNTRPPKHPTAGNWMYKDATVTQ